MEEAVDNTSNENADDKQADNKTDVAEKSATSHTQDQPKKSKKEDRKKDDKNIEQFMKSLNTVPTLEEKLSLVCKKYVQTADENKKLQFYIKQSDKRYALLMKEKDQLQHEYNKTVLVKSKLENLCRELQKQNKAIKEESLLKIREEEERRKETQAKFQNTLSEITTLLQQNNEKNTKLRDDNINMSEKFKGVVQQYQLREQQVEKMAKQMALESQLSEAKLQKANLEHQAEKGRLLAEMEQLKMEAAQCHAKIQELQGTEVALRSQIDVYTDKYDEFQNALVKSNQVFGGFKGEMEKMSKKIQMLEKESLSYKKRWETAQTALIDMCTERQASEEKAIIANRHLTHMQGLCRTLQGERTVLLNTLKEHNIERPPLPAAAPAPAPAPAQTTAPAAASAGAPASNSRMESMTANCAQLRQSLAHLQNQLNVLTTKKESKDEAVKPEKKKSKSKKNKGDKAQAESVQEKPTENEQTVEESNDIENTNQDIKSEATDKSVNELIEVMNQANLSHELEGDEKTVIEGNNLLSNEAKPNNISNDDKVQSVTDSTGKTDVGVENGVENIVMQVENTVKAVDNEAHNSSVTDETVNDIALMAEIKSLLDQKQEVATS